MREGLFETAGDDLSLQALLYASGELEGPELAAFEERLAQDQSARDALSQAVELSLTLEGKADQGPEPEVRARIRHRLRQRRRARLAASQSTGLIGHPAVWSLIGALAAVVLLLLFGQVMALFEATNPEPAPPPPKPAPTKAELESGQAELEAEAQRLAEQIRAASPTDRPALEAQLLDLSRQLATIDVELQRIRVNQLAKELGQVKDDLGRTQEERARDRFEGFLKK